MRVLAVAADPEFLEELRNYLLSAGCGEVQAAARLPEPADRGAAQRFDAVVVDGTGDPAATVRALRRWREGGLATRVVVLSEPGDDEGPGSPPDAPEGVQWLLKHTFARHLLTILEEAGP